MLLFGARCSNVPRNCLGATGLRYFNVKSTPRLGFPCAYSEEETRKILNKLNEEDVEQLYKYNISKFRLKKIEGWRKKFGTFMSLDQVLELDGFGITVLRKFYDSIVKNPEDVEAAAQKVVKKDVKFTTPIFPVNIIPKIQSCVSLYVGLDYVTWARFKLSKDEPTVLTGWNSFQINDRKLHVSELIRNVTQINQLIPEADVYVVENPAVAQAVAMGSATQTNINVQKSQLIAMIMLMLSNRVPDSSEIVPNVYFFKQYASARLFGIYVGNERVSADGVVRSLMERQIGPNEESVENVQSKVVIPSGLKVVYEENDNAEREFLGQSMLLGLSFLRLCVFKCEDSLKIFRR
ncbi:AAEL008584-PA [Aedes aegypti]|uniref:AAEL008584-PA n=1 Tax=Aedes aegypti TaxID=7159 RepID=Q16YC8_AEDAE|nr:AAEL008584-PA [Aedes aegypti]